MAATPPQEPRRVLLDVNVYLDAAEVIGPGTALSVLPDPPPPVVGMLLHPAAQVLTVALEWVFARPLLLTPCVSNHVINTAMRKLTDPSSAGGVGWAENDAIAFVQAVLDAFYEVGGIDIDVDAPRHRPPLDYEDGMVVASAIKAQCALPDHLGQRLPHRCRRQVRARGDVTARLPPAREPRPIPGGSMTDSTLRPVRPFGRLPHMYGLSSHLYAVLSQS